MPSKCITLAYYLEGSNPSVAGSNPAGRVQIPVVRFVWVTFFSGLIYPSTLYPSTLYPSAPATCPLGVDVVVSYRSVAVRERFNRIVGEAHGR